jgi:hypothetical protein
MEEQVNYLTLKWGTLKSWDFSHSEKGIALLKEFHKIGMNPSAACQKNTPRQKEIICELIDLCDDSAIYLEWDDTYVSKQDAKNYVINYGNK